MSVIPYTDPVVAVETLLNELFQNVFQNDSARHHFGFSKISQLTTSEGMAQWYLWFSDKRGAFSLTIEEDHVASDDNRIHPYLLIRYFPDIEEGVFDSLSCYEQIARMGSLFDATGTPTFEGGCTMHGSLFVTGRIDVNIHSSKSDVDFYCTAPDKWRDFRTDGLTLMDDKMESKQVLFPGELDRDFPGWDLSFFLFDKIISSFCFLTGQTPRYTGRGEKPSFHFAIDIKEKIDIVSDATITDSMMGVSFFELTNRKKVMDRYQSFKETMLSQNHKLVDIWKNSDTIPASLSVPAWWEIKNRHFHADAHHVCSCYE